MRGDIKPVPRRRGTSNDPTQIMYFLIRRQGYTSVGNTVAIHHGGFARQRDRKFLHNMYHNLEISLKNNNLDF